MDIGLRLSNHKDGTDSVPREFSDSNHKVDDLKPVALSLKELNYPLQLDHLAQLLLPKFF